MARGEESALPARDRGPVKRFIRDRVDSRWTVGEILMPVLLLLLVLSLLPNRTMQFALLMLIWLAVLAGGIDAVLLWRRIRTEATARFGSEPPKGSASYAMMRTFQMRLMRQPRPQVKRGAKV